MKWFVRVLALLAISPLVFAVGEKTFRFTPPTLYEDGTPLPQSAIASYDIECDGSLLATVLNEPEDTDSYQAQPGTFPTGSHACEAFTVTTEGVRSGPSNTVNFTVAPGVPASPTNFVIE